MTPAKKILFNVVFLVVVEHSAKSIVASKVSLVRTAVVVCVLNVMLHLVTILAVLWVWVRADHDVWDFGPVDNQWEHCMRSIVVSKSSPAHAADAVSDQRCDPLSGHCGNTPFTKSAAEYV